MKLVKRLFSMLLVLTMILVLAACGGTTGNTDSSGTNNPQNPSNPSNPGNNDDVFVLPDRPVDETQGKTYTIIQHADVENPFGYSQDSLLGIKVTERLDEVKALYGCDIVFSTIPYDNDFVTKIQALRFAENGGDLVFSHKNAQLRKALGTGGDSSLMQDLLAVDDIINFWDENKWGTLAARESMMAGGTFYGVSPALWEDCTPLPYFQVVYNRDLVENSGATDPQEYWENDAWDREAMLEVIAKTTDEASGIWGMSASIKHMTRASIVSTGIDIVTIERINVDGTAEWSTVYTAPDTMEALSWLKSTLTAHKKCFNNNKSDWDGWLVHEPFNEELCAMAVSRPLDVLSSVVVDGPSNFGITTWAGRKANILTGYYEQVYSVAIPVFAQNIKHSAFLMYDLFEGLGDVEDYEDVLAFYADTYFNTELDITCFVREKAILSYSYWPNGVDAIIGELSQNLMYYPVTTLISKFAHTVDKEIEEHIVPNKVALYQWQQGGYFD